MTRTVLVAHPGAELYGSDRMAAETVRGLVEVGCRVHVVVPSRGPLLAQLQATGATVHVLALPVLRKAALRPAGLLRLLLGTVRATPAALRLLRRSAPDVVYVSTLSQPAWMVLARVVRTPVVCHVHEAEATLPRPVRVGLALPLLLSRTVVANSGFTRRVAVDAVPALERRTVVVVNGVEGPTRSLPDVTLLRGPGDRLDVLYVGRLSARKGVDVLLDAVSQAVRQGVDVHLTLVGAVFRGNEEYETALRAKAGDAPLRGRVTFSGFDADVWRQAERCHVWVVPSRGDESFGNTAVEAVLAGRPLIASRTSGLQEAAAGYGSAVLVEPDDAVALADSLVDLDRRWRERCATVAEDRSAAEQRHDPAVYRRAVAAALGVGPVTSPPSGPLARGSR